MIFVAILVLNKELITLLFFFRALAALAQRRLSLRHVGRSVVGHVDLPPPEDQGLKESI